MAAPHLSPLSSPRFHVAPRWRAVAYAAILLAINAFFVKKLFFVEFTNNMQTNAGSFMAISRFILHYFPHLDWFPWWFNGEPFENAYTPMLPLMGAAFAWITGASVARAFQFVTATLYALGPLFLFVFAWRISRRLETSFFAALLYSLFSPCAIFGAFRVDVGGLWNPWRLRVLVDYGEGPHTAALSLLPLALFAIYKVITAPNSSAMPQGFGGAGALARGRRPRRPSAIASQPEKPDEGVRRGSGEPPHKNLAWRVAAGFSMAFLVLTNAFAAIDLGIGALCLLIALGPNRLVPLARSAITITTIALLAYLWASPFLTPTFLHTMSQNSQRVEGDYRTSRLLVPQLLLIAAFLAAYLATLRVRDRFTRFTILFAVPFIGITAIYAIGGRAVLPQPNRYSLEMDMGVALAAAFLIRPLAARLPAAFKIAGVVAILVLALHQTVYFRRYARQHIQKIDITKTIEYRIAQAANRNPGGMRALISAQAGTWLNVFSDVPQMDAGHGPFNPNFAAQQAAAYSIYSGENAGSRDAAVSILWLQAYGCDAVHVSGPASRVAGKPFRNPHKFDGILPVLWREEDDTIYAVPQRSRSLAHVVPASAIVKDQPINGLDTDEASRYVAAVENPALPDAALTWSNPTRARIATTLDPGQVISVQNTYDKGWIASANGRPAAVRRDGLGLTVIHPACDGPCTVDFVFDGGLERKVCRALSLSVSAAVLLLIGFALLRAQAFLAHRPISR